jgi:hypothetical protein
MNHGKGKVCPCDDFVEMNILVELDINSDKLEIPHG